MPKKAASLSINLLPKKEIEFSDKFLNWSLTFGRYIIIGTEIIVLIAFFSRFKFDRDLIDLNDQVKDKQKILVALAPVENEVDRLQARLGEIKTIEDAQSLGISALPSIALFTPEEITYKYITVTGSKVTIVGTTQETVNMSHFVGMLSSSNLFKQDSVTLEKVERKEEDKLITFTITATVEKEKQ